MYWYIQAIAGGLKGEDGDLSAQRVQHYRFHELNDIIWELKRFSWCWWGQKNTSLMLIVSFFLLQSLMADMLILHRLLQVDWTSTHPFDLIQMRVVGRGGIKAATKHISSTSKTSHKKQHSNFYQHWHQFIAEIRYSCRYTHGVKVNNFFCPPVCSSWQCGVSLFIIYKFYFTRARGVPQRGKDLSLFSHYVQETLDAQCRHRWQIRFRWNLFHGFQTQRLTGM